jgi:hypothetical protein
MSLPVPVNLNRFGSGGDFIFGMSDPFLLSVLPSSRACWMRRD